MLRKIGFISTFPPQKCGIATYTKMTIDCTNQSYKKTSYPIIILVESNAEIRQIRKYYKGSRETLLFLRKDCPDAFRKLAREVNRSNQISAICLQHEFSLFGGSGGDYILHFLHHLKKPLITTFHTVTEDLPRHHKYVQQKIAEKSRYIITPTEHARNLLHESLFISKKKIVYIPLAAPSPPENSRDSIREELGWSNNNMILTFGLLHRGKGIELILDALSTVVRSVPNVRYIILGETHPNVKRIEGESYRTELQDIILKKGLSQHVFFINRYVTDTELTKYLVACDLYITPYQRLDQASSATLAYAIGLRRPVLSTPYQYAKEALQDASECLIPYESRDDWAKRITSILSDREFLSDWETRISPISNQLDPKRVGKMYRHLFRKVQYRF